MFSREEEEEEEVLLGCADEGTRRLYFPHIRLESRLYPVPFLLAYYTFSNGSRLPRRLFSFQNREGVSYYCSMSLQTDLTSCSQPVLCDSRSSYSSSYFSSVCRSIRQCVWLSFQLFLYFCYLPIHLRTLLNYLSTVTTHCCR